MCSVVCCHQDKRAVERLSLEKVFHPFIAGAHNRLVQELSQETGARISIPPPSLPKDEIVITGEKEAVALALHRIRAIYEDKVWSRRQELSLGYPIAIRLPYFPDYKLHFFIQSLARVGFILGCDF